MNDKIELDELHKKKLSLDQLKIKLEKEGKELEEKEKLEMKELKKKIKVLRGVE